MYCVYGKKKLRLDASYLWSSCKLALFRCLVYAWGLSDEQLGVRDSSHLLTGLEACL